MLISSTYAWFIANNTATISTINVKVEYKANEYFENGICIIEWGELIKDALPKDYIHITFEKDDSNENYRKLKVETFGNKYQNLF